MENDPVKKAEKPFADISLLYVEDESVARAGMEMTLSRYVGNLYTAEDGQKGLALYEEHKPDLIITDLSMPVLNGLELSRQIKAHSPEVPIIVTSAQNDSKQLIDAINIGVDYFIMKPIDFNRLFGAIRKASSAIISKRQISKTNKRMQQYKMALDSSAIFSIADANGNITFANEKFCDISGYEIEEIIGHNHNILRHSEMPKEIYEDLWQTIRSGNIWKGVIKNRKKNGGYYYVDSTIFPVIDENDEIVEYLGIRYDITALIENEIMLREAMEKAKEANRAKSEFLANMSHEIRTPMNGIMGFLDVLESTKLEEKQNEYVQIVKSSASHLMQIVNDILDLSKIESGKMSLESASFNALEEFENCVLLFFAKAQEKRIILESFFDETIPDTLLGDSVRIRQVLSNLISNAIKFTPEEGSVEVHVNVVQLTDFKCRLRFMVKDDGIGISKGIRERIFSPFEQADVSTTRKYGGTGLGLSISQKIVAMMDGVLELKSEEGWGSEFSFELEFVIPRGEAAEQGVSQDIYGACFEPNKLIIEAKILVAEDNSVNRKLLDVILNDIGIDVVMVENGEQAFQQILAGGFDLVLMDINMPVMDGLESTAKIIQYEKENGIKHVPIVALTANALQGDRQKYLEAGMDGYLAKPVSRERLMQQLIEILPDRHLQCYAPDLEEIQTTEISVVKELVDALGIPEDVARMILDEYFGSIFGELEKLKKAVDAGDLEQICSIAHSIKGSSANLRLDNISKMASEIQSAIDKNDAMDFNEQYAKMQKEIEVTKNNYERMRAK